MEIPDTVKEVTDGCFVYFSSGKSVNIPQNADLLSSLRICDVALGTEKVTISPKNKYCKIKDGCLLTKDGKELLDIVDNRKKVVVPSCVKKITASMRKCVKTIVIPENIKRISSLAFDSEKNSIIVECKGKIPPQIESGFNYQVSHITVYVPKGCVETYKNACKFPIEEHEILDFIEK